MPLTGSSEHAGTNGAVLTFPRGIAFEITVRDSSGTVLEIRTDPCLWDVGDQLTLTDGTHVRVTGIKDKISVRTWQTITVAQAHDHREAGDA
jgi:hypothetical protein